jgi:hypothetical protein
MVGARKYLILIKIYIREKYLFGSQFIYELWHYASFAKYDIMSMAKKKIGTHFWECQCQDQEHYECKQMPQGLMGIWKNSPL